MFVLPLLLLYVSSSIHDSTCSAVLYTVAAHAVAPASALVAASAAAAAAAPAAAAATGVAASAALASFLWFRRRCYNMSDRSRQKVIINWENLIK